MPSEHDGQDKPSDQDVEWARCVYSRALRELTANLLRVAAGAGKPHRVLEDAASFIHAFMDYEPHMSFHERIDGPRDILAVREDHRDCDIRRVYEAEEDIIIGALRIAASRLLEQRTQEAAGRTLMTDGINQHEAARAELRRVNSRRGYYQSGFGGKEWDDA